MLRPEGGEPWGLSAKKMWIKSQLTDCYAKKELTTGLVYTEIINETTELAALISLLRTVSGHFIVIFKASLLVNYFALHNRFACLLKWMERVIRHFNYFFVLRQKHCTETPFTGTKKNPHGTPNFCHRASFTREVVSAPLKFWALVPYYFWDRYVYTSKIGSAVPDFLARVNGV